MATAFNTDIDLDGEPNMTTEMIEDFKKKPSHKLLDQIIGLKFKHIRLKKDITAEAVVGDNPLYFAPTA